MAIDGEQPRKSSSLQTKISAGNMDTYVVLTLQTRERKSSVAAGRSIVDAPGESVLCAAYDSWMVYKEILNHFANCEVHSVVIVDSGILWHLVQKIFMH
ncbi:hypothetical protein MKW98_012963 [Papaver atlanticum]|uniref:Uncharacterized protein n=1 Tax=Papaver atlanticum TaxID=357466 RepID=A0AAD4XFN3_9MAGN|nr:hypothetical protein MKW98_012963 [Papaver atlanticum]